MYGQYFQKSKDQPHIILAELGRNPVSKHQFQSEYSMEMSRLTRDGTAEPVSRDQVLRRERG